MWMRGQGQRRQCSGLSQASSSDWLTVSWIGSWATRALPLEGFSMELMRVRGLSIWESRRSMVFWIRVCRLMAAAV